MFWEEGRHWDSQKAKKECLEEGWEGVGNKHRPYSEMYMGITATLVCYIHIDN